MSQFIKYVLRTIDVIQFAKVWIEHEGKKGGKQWKSEGEVLMDNLRSTQRDYENMEAMRGNEENLEADEALMEKEEEIRQLKKAYTTA